MLKTGRNLLLVCAAAVAVLTAASSMHSGVDRSGMDTSCKPCDDFWRYANGSWIDTHPIPAQYATWGTMPVLSDANRERLKVILDAAAANTSAPADSNERKIGAFYSACLDTEAIDRRGYDPLKPELEKVAKIASPKDVAATIVALQKTAPVGPVMLMGSPDMKNAKEVIANVGVGGLSLPDRDYYFKDDEKSKKIREEFVAHVARMLQLIGDSPEKSQEEARQIMAFETSFAESTPTNVERRNPYSRYHKMDFAGLQALSPDFDWKPLFSEFGVSTSVAINVTEPKLVEKLETQLTSAPVDTWKAWLRWRLASGSARMLSKPFRDEDFHFSSTVLTGVQKELPRWQTCAAAVDSQMGDALGQVFVQKHFPPDAKKRMAELVENLRASLKDQLETAEWLTPETRKNAIAKLTAFRPKVGYPDRWRDYSGLKVRTDAYYDDSRAAMQFNRDWRLAKIGKPVDRNDWGMTTPTVNAYYSPNMNEIVFPAGILQPPMFDLTSDDAANYGAIGAVIGHEMGHGFDDQGSKFDAEGNLKNWWTDEDRKKFDQRAGCVINQFNTIDVGEGLHHKGQLVVGEAMGDLGGLTLAYKAYKRSLNGKEAPVIDGFTGDQRFFLAFARVWATQYRPEAMRLRLNTDPHPLPKYRANATLANMPEFRAAFHCKQGDSMVRPDSEACKLW